MPQTAVSALLIGVDGQLADLWTELNGDVAPLISEEASAEIPFGVAVKKGAADDGALKLTAITEAVHGIVVYSPLFSKPDELGDVGLKPKVSFGVLRVGRILARPENSVTPASGVFVRAVATGNEVAGAFRGTADGTDTIDISAFASWRSTAGAGELAVLEIDLMST